MYISAACQVRARCARAQRPALPSNDTPSREAPFVAARYLRPLSDGAGRPASGGAGLVYIVLSLCPAPWPALPTARLLPRARVSKPASATGSQDLMIGRAQSPFEGAAGSALNNAGHESPRMCVPIRPVWPAVPPFPRLPKADAMLPGRQSREKFCNALAASTSLIGMRL
jgi:hypothetical protein